MVDFEKIRQQLRAVVKEHGGKIEINEWNTSSGNVLKVVLTFKDSAPNYAGLNWDNLFRDEVK